MKRNARRAKLSVDDGFRSETESPSFKSDDLQEAPLPKVSLNLNHWSETHDVSFLNKIIFFRL